MEIADTGWGIAESWLDTEGSYSGIEGSSVLAEFEASWERFDPSYCRTTCHWNLRSHQSFLVRGSQRLHWRRRGIDLETARKIRTGLTGIANFADKFV
jgi:hypothetical protein